MSQETAALARRWFEEVWNQNNAAAIDAFMVPDVVAHGLGEGGTDLHGVDAFKAFHTAYLGAFPDLRIVVEDVISEGDRTAVRFTGEGTHQGDHLGIPATRRKMTFTGMSITLWKDGKILEGWNNVDMLAIMTQIGAVRPAQAGESPAAGPK